MSEEKRKLDGVIGFAVYGSMIVGSLGIVASVFAFLAADLSAGAMFLVASGLAFGLLTNAVLRQ
jgi:hypothetical protein